MVQTVRDDDETQMLWDEIEHNRRSERWLVPKAAFALGLVAILSAIRVVFFQ